MRDDDKDDRSPGRRNYLGGDPGEDLRNCLKLLDILPGDRVIEFGCWAGEFLAAALEAGAERLTGVDAAANRLEQTKLRLKGDPRAELVNAAPTEFYPGERTFTKGLARNVLRALPADRKRLFFARLGRSFLPGGLFLLEDFIFDFERRELDLHWPGLMKDCAAYYGAAWSRREKEIAACFKNEYPEGVKGWTAALEAGGFRVLRRLRRSPFRGLLLAEKAA